MRAWAAEPAAEAMEMGADAVAGDTAMRSLPIQAGWRGPFAKRSELAAKRARLVWRKRNRAASATSRSPDFFSVGSN